VRYQANHPSKPMLGVESRPRGCGDLPTGYGRVLQMEQLVQAVMKQVSRCVRFSVLKHNHGSFAGAFQKRATRTATP
jgi:hypothetical protein